MGDKLLFQLRRLKKCNSKCIVQPLSTSYTDSPFTLKLGMSSKLNRGTGLLLYCNQEFSSCHQCSNASLILLHLDYNFTNVDLLLILGCKWSNYCDLKMNYTVVRPALWIFINTHLLRIEFEFAIFQRTYTRQLNRTAYSVTFVGRACKV